MIRRDQQTRDAWKASSVFLEPASIGNIIRWSCVLEHELDIALCLYFSAPGRHDDYINLIASKINFNDKIRILDSIIKNKPSDRRNEAKEIIKAFQRIRNLAAHQAYKHIKTIREAMGNPLVKDMLLNYPLVTKQKMIRCSSILKRLPRTKDWKVSRSSSIPTHDDLLSHLIHVAITS